MPRGDKSSYTDKQKRKAEHIEEGYEHRGVGKAEAERRAWATVNAETGGGKKSGERQRARQGREPRAFAQGRAQGRCCGGIAHRRRALRIGQEGGRHPQAQRRATHRLS